MNERFLRLSPRGEEPAGFAPAALASDAMPREAQEDISSLPRDREIGPRDWAVFLLHTAAEIEHALLVQYLYAAYSINPDLEIPGTGGKQTDIWRGRILAIAQEEMGHLLCLQNVLHVLGGPLNFEREDFPFRSMLYPFRFALRTFTKNSLAKYVAAEMPAVVDEQVLPKEERAEIWRRAMKGEGGQTEPVNHVGTLYRALIDHVDHGLALGDFRTDRGLYQATPDEEWGEDNEKQVGVKAIPVSGATPAIVKKKVKRCLRVIARQGEGASASDVTDSHFLRFLEIYRQFPDAGFDPAFPVGTDPYLPDDPRATPRKKADPITHPTTQLYAKLFNVRYRILLALLAHLLEIPNDAEGKPIRARMVEWVFNEMSEFKFGPAAIRELAKKLAELPRGRTGKKTAGATFGLPYTVQLPPRSPDRWRLHLDLIDSTREIIEAIAKPPTETTLVSIYKYEFGPDGQSGRRKTVAGLLNSPY